MTLQVFTTYLSYRLPWFKRAVEGEPIVLVQDGKLVERNLRRERLTVGDVMEQARLEHIASLDTVRWAVLEQNGKVSFILNEPKESV